MRIHVFLFAKEPRLGRVKTRLARDIGALQALVFYRNTLCRTIRELKGDPRLKLTIAITPDRLSGRKPAWAQGVRLTGQGRGTLGQRMARTIRTAPQGPVIIIGSDIPAIRRSDLLVAASILGRADAVFGPSSDGGYWLVGMKRLRPLSPDLFRNVRWSSPHALRDSCATLAKTNTVQFAGQLDDVDDGVTYRRWKQGRVNDRQ